MCVLVWGRVCVCGVLWVWCVGRGCGGVYTRTYTVHSQTLRSHFVLKPHTMFGAGGWDLGKQGWDQQGRDQRQQGWDQQGWDQRQQGWERGGDRGGQAPRDDNQQGNHHEKWSATPREGRWHEQNKWPKKIPSWKKIPMTSVTENIPRTPMPGGTWTAKTIPQRDYQ